MVSSRLSLQSDDAGIEQSNAQYIPKVITSRIISQVAIGLRGESDGALSSSEAASRGFSQLRELAPD